MKNWILLLYIWCPFFASGQQTAQYSLFALNPFGWNPAYAGMDNSLVATGVWRKQWNGLDGGPVTQHANVHLPVYAIRSGLGLLVENESPGAHRQTSGLLAWNYQMPVGRDGVLSAGLSGGFSQIVLDGTLIRTPEGTYPDQQIGSHNDPQLTYNKESAGAPVFGAGVFFVKGKMEAGLAAQQLGKSRWKFSQNLTLNSRQTISASAGRTFGISENLTLKPVFLVKTDFAETQMELTLVARLREKILGGVAFRGFSGKSRDAFTLFGGTKLNERTTVAYSYDITVSKLSTVSRGSHELLLQYNLGKELGKGRLPSVIFNPRF